MTICKVPIKPISWRLLIPHIPIIRTPIHYIPTRLSFTLIELFPSILSRCLITFITHHTHLFSLHHTLIFFIYPLNSFHHICMAIAILASIPPIVSYSSPYTSSQLTHFLFPPPFLSLHHTPFMHAVFSLIYIFPCHYSMHITTPLRPLTHSCSLLDSRVPKVPCTCPLSSPHPLIFHAHVHHTSFIPCTLHLTHPTLP